MIPPKLTELIKGRNGLSSEEIYSSRESFKYAVIASGDLDNLYSLWDVGRHYGFVDQQFNTINIEGKTQVLLDNLVIKDLGAPGKVVYGINFVADAFWDFMAFYNLLAPAGKLNPTENRLVKLTPAKGLINVRHQHEEHVRGVYESFVNDVFNKNLLKKIITFKDFMREFKSFLFRTAGEVPITRSGFSRSIFVDPHCSGLLLEIDSLDYDDDAKKVEQYYNNKNFSTYKSTANNFGFGIDANAPWRLIAKPTSPRMRAYMERYQIDPDMVFDNWAYSRTCDYDLLLLKGHLLKMFNAIALSNPKQIDYKTKFDCPGPDPRVPGNIVTIQSFRRQITMEEVNMQFGDFSWMKFYYQTRLLEEGFEVMNEEVTKTVRDAIILGTGPQNVLDIQKTMRYIDGKINNRYVVARKLL